MTVPANLSQTENNLVLEIRDNVAFATIDRRQARNALSSDMRENLMTFLEGLRDDPGVRAIVIQATGDGFIAGGDVKVFARGLDMAPNERASDMYGRALGAGRLAAVMASLPQPVIVAARGHALGIGASIVFAADFAIVSDTIDLRLSHVNLGISPDGAATYFLTRQVGRRRALQIAMLGEAITAKDLLDFGLVNWVVPDSELEARALALAQRFVSGPRTAHREIKKLIGQVVHERSFRSDRRRSRRA